MTNEELKVWLFIVGIALSIVGMIWAWRSKDDNGHRIDWERFQVRMDEHREQERIKKRIADIQEIYTELRIQMPHLNHEDAADRAVEIYEQRKLIS